MLTWLQQREGSAVGQEAAAVAERSTRIIMRQVDLMQLSRVTATRDERCVACIAAASHI